MDEEIGRSLGDLATGGRGLRIYRRGKPHGYWEEEARRLEGGDMVVEIVPTPQNDQDSDQNTAPIAR